MTEQPVEKKERSWAARHWVKFTGFVVALSAFLSWYDGVRNQGRLFICDVATFIGQQEAISLCRNAGALLGIAQQRELLNYLKEREDQLSPEHRAKLRHLEAYFQERVFSELEKAITDVPLIPEIPENPVQENPTRRPYVTASALQWNLLNNGTLKDQSPGGTNIERAWSTSKGSQSVVVAILSTGILLDHPAIAGSSNITGGYDMISDPKLAGDGDGRDSNPYDPGDASDPGECFPGSPKQENSWVGTHLASIVGVIDPHISTTSVSINRYVRVQPVRVIGKCGGVLPDIHDGILWAAGINVAGTPKNPTPANVILLAFGGGTRCSLAPNIQSAINQAIAAGASVVAPAGNQALNASEFLPGGCDGPITVAASDARGHLAKYSNYGPRIDIMAPGGDVRQDNDGDGLPDGILGAVSGGFTFYNGTTMAAAHVAGVIALMLSYDPGLSPHEIKQRLKAHAIKRGKKECPTYCGAGLLNADVLTRRPKQADTSRDTFQHKI